MRNKEVFIHTLDLISFFWLVATWNKPKKVFYISQKVSPKLMLFLKKRVACEQTDLYVGTDAYIENEKNLYTSVEKVFKNSKFYSEVASLLNILNLETEKLITSFKKYLIHLIFDDMKIITLARQLCKNGDHKRVIVNNCGLLKETVGGSIDINKNSSLMYSIKGRMLFLAATLLCLKKILNQRRDKKLNTFTRVKIIFEQIYKGQEGNSEFDVFYRYFKERDDVLYICISNDSKIYKTLKNDRKPVLIKNDIPLLLQSRLLYLKCFVKLFFRLIFSIELKSWYLKSLLLTVFDKKMYYESLFKRYNPSFYLKIRSDIDPSHPVATAVAKKYNVKHIGYQHGSYYFMAVFAYIDFHFYGLLGECFLKETFSHIWPKNIQYSVTGPITVEGTNDDKEPIKGDKKFVVGIFTNIRDDNNQYWHSLYQQFLEILCYKISELCVPGFHLVFKEKGYSEYSEKLIVGLCHKYNLSYEIAYHLHPTKIPSNYSHSVIEKFNVHGMSSHLEPAVVRLFCTSIEVISTSDIIVEITQYGCSTTTYEALGKKKKILIFATKHFQNILGKFIPKLIVRNEDEFEDGMKFLMNISQPEYEEYIQPAIENCCKVSNGNLVRDFISSIENCVKDNSNKECIGSSR